MSTKRPPNVVLVMSDQHRRDSSGCYGHPLVQTPNLDRLAASGATFTQAYAAAPICGPCRSATLTGRQLHRCGGLTHRHIRRDMGLPTMGTAFRDAGYVTGAFGKLHVAGETDERDLGFDERALRIYTPTATDYQHAIGLENFWKYCSYLPQYRPSEAHEPRNNYNPRNAPIELPDELILDQMVADRSLDFLERHRDEPFFLWVGFEKPHTEWYAPQRFHDLYDPAAIELPDDIWESRDHLPETVRNNPHFPIVTREAYTDDELRCCIAAYYANISYMDDQLGRVLDGLDRLGLADDTIVVYTSDHGENLFNHGLVHKLCFYETAVAVPLVVRLPGREGGVRREQLTSLVDLFPTLTDACGVTPPDGLDGASLLPAIERDETVHDAVFSEFYEYGTAERMVRRGQWKYVHSHDDTHQLYDLAADPGEHRNLALEPGHEAICRELDELLCRDWTLPDLSDVPKIRGDWRTFVKS